MRRRSLVFLILLLTMVTWLPACGGNQGATPSPPEQASSWKLAAYNTLAESKVAYDKAFTALGMADQAGKLKPADKALAIKYGKMYRDAHNLAVNMLLNNMQPNLAALRTALSLFESVALPYLTKGVS